MDWAITLAVIAGVTAGIAGTKAWAYRRWWLDACEQRDRARAGSRALARRLTAYRAAAADQLDALDSPDRPGGTRPDPVEGA